MGCPSTPRHYTDNSSLGFNHSCHCALLHVFYRAGPEVERSIISLKRWMKLFEMEHIPPEGSRSSWSEMKE